MSWRPGEVAVVQCGEDLPGAVDFEGVGDASSEEQQVGGADHQDRGRGGDRRVAGLVGGVAEVGRPGRRRDQAIIAVPPNSGLWLCQVWMAPPEGGIAGLSGPTGDSPGSFCQV